MRPSLSAEHLLVVPLSGSRGNRFRRLLVFIAIVGLGLGCTRAPEIRGVPAELLLLRVADKEVRILGSSEGIESRVPPPVGIDARGPLVFHPTTKEGWGWSGKEAMFEVGTRDHVIHSITWGRKGLTESEADELMQEDIVQCGEPEALRVLETSKSYAWTGGDYARVTTASLNNGEWSLVIFIAPTSDLRRMGLAPVLKGL